MDKDMSMETLELDYLGDADLETQPEPEVKFFGIGTWKIFYPAEWRPNFSRKLDMWLAMYKKPLKVEAMRLGLIIFSLAAVWWNGHATAARDFDISVRAGLYVENATMMEQLAKPKSGAWAGAGTEEVTK